MYTSNGNHRVNEFICIPLMVTTELMNLYICIPLMVTTELMNNLQEK